MSSRCRFCGEEMPKDRKGWEQVCPKCRTKGRGKKYKSVDEIIKSLRSPLFTLRWYWFKFIKWTRRNKDV